MNDSEKLAAIAAIVGGTVTHTGVATPELALSQIDPATIDGTTCQADGSVWMYDAYGAPIQWVYGYFNRDKCPILYDRCAEIMGAERLEDQLRVGGPNAQYKQNPASVAYGGDPNALTLGMCFSNPIVRGA